MTYIPVCSIQVLLPRLFLKLVAFTVGRIRKWSQSSYSGQVLYWSSLALVEFCTGLLLHGSSFAPVKFSTGQTAQVKLHRSSFALVKFSTGQTAQVKFCTRQTAQLKFCTGLV